ncbi:hypothetical protein [Clostridium sp. CCUG 7971]|uniref:hypothetical protein n=1 Tax=Clostridium sp. CCUG 7971 TaxID=2811414 RepID=UPI00257033BD|nr:hypothetical protein [Clostridium sp. CCUG 7971]
MNQKDLKSTNVNPKDLKSMSMNQLIEIRDKAIDKNLEPLRKSGEDFMKERKDSILTFEFGLVAFVDKTYCNLNQKEKLIKQIEIVDYENNMDDVIDPSGSFLEGIHTRYQINQYLLEKGKDPKYYESYDSLKFLIDNLQELCDFVGSDILKDALESVQSSIGLQSQEQQQSLRADFKKARKGLSR